MKKVTRNYIHCLLVEIYAYGYNGKVTRNLYRQFAMVFNYHNILEILCLSL